jgi:NAD(P)-dependent dehydrogenase (short-subunit alcohol dehydrogenase family)
MINVKGLFFTIQKTLPLLPDGASIILNPPVVAGKRDSVNWIFSATTAAMRSFARIWAMDLKDRRIRVNTVSPGSIEAPGLNALILSTEAGEQRLRMRSSDIPLSKPSTLDQIVEAVISLCDESSDVTGTELFMDGGMAHLEVLSDNVPLGRLGTPDEIAKSALFLASDDSNQITGIELFLDGGMAEL